MDGVLPQSDAVAVALIVMDGVTVLGLAWIASRRTRDRRAGRRASRRLIPTQRQAPTLRTVTDGDGVELYDPVDRY